MVLREVCYLHPPKDFLGVPDKETRRDISLIGCVHRTTIIVVSRRNMSEQLSHHEKCALSLGGGPPFAPKHVFFLLCIPSRTKSSFSDTDWPLWYPAVVLKGVISDVRSDVHDDLFEVFTVHSIWPWTPGLKYLTDYEASPICWLFQMLYGPFAAGLFGFVGKGMNLHLSYPSYGLISRPFI